MADFEKLNDEPGLKRFLGIKRFPDETTLGQWIVDQSRLYRMGDGEY